MSRWPVVLCAAVALTATPAAAQDDGDEEEILLIEDDESDDDEIIIIEDDESDDDEILIIDDDEEADPEPFVSPISGALGRLWEAWHVDADSDASFRVQATPPGDGPWRLNAGLAAESWLLPAPNLSFYGSAFGRLVVDGTPEGRVIPFWDVNEAYAKISAPAGAVQLGRLVIPYGKTQGTAFGDRLLPPDHRRGPAFPLAAKQRQPQWGGTVRTSLGALSLEGVLLVLYEPTEGSIAAADQGGVRIARYQGAIIRSPGRVGGLGSSPFRDDLLAEPDFIDAASAGLRARRRLGDFDLGGSVVMGLDETPSLSLRPEVARYLANEYLVAVGAPPSALETFPCERGVSTQSCLGGAGTLRHERAVSFSADASWGLGIVILRAEVLAQPAVGALPGKTALLVSEERGVHSERISHYAGAFAVEGALGEWVSGSVELFDAVWFDVPAGTRLYGVELAESDATAARAVHRLGVAATLSGSLLDERLIWTLRGEGGVLQLDTLVSAQLRYRLPVLNLYVGGHGDAYAGLPGSPGWFRQDASAIGIFLGEGA